MKSKLFPLGHHLWVVLEDVFRETLFVHVVIFELDAERSRLIRKLLGTFCSWSRLESLKSFLGVGAQKSGLACILIE